MRKPAILAATCVTLLCLVGAPAFAQDYPPDVEGEEEEIAPAQEGDGLPTTGANMTLFAATGMIAVGAGVFLVSRSRSRRAASQNA